MSRTLVLVVLLGLALIVQAQDPASGNFAYSVRIDAQGRVLTFEAVSDAKAPALPAAVENALREQLLARTYTRTDTRGGTLITWLAGAFEAKAQGGGLALSVTDLRAGPHPIRLDLPHAPMELTRGKIEVDLVLRVKVDASGKPSLVALDGIEALSREHAKRLEERIAHTMKVWRFRPERWDGRPIESEQIVALQYRTERGDATDWDWRGPALTQIGPLQVPADDFRPLSIGLSAKRR